MTATGNRWATAAVILGTALAAARPAGAEPGAAALFVVGNGIAGGVLCAVNAGLAIASSVDTVRPRANRDLAAASIAFGTLGVASGLVSLGFGVDFWFTKPGYDSTVEFQHQMAGLHIAAGVLSAALGAVSMGLGIHNLGRPEAKVPPLPTPVVLGDRRTGPLPGLAWNVRF